jgi:hypothetical protein
MLEERSGCQFCTVCHQCQIPLLLNPICPLFERLQDPPRCCQEKYLHPLRHELLQTSIVSLTAPGSRLGQITHLVPQQGLYNPDYHHLLHHRDYPHRNREVYIVQLETMKRRKCHQYLQYRRPTSHQRTLQLNHPSSTSANRVCLLTPVASIALQRIAYQGGDQFESRRNTIENQKPGNMAILRIQMLSSRIRTPL